MKEVNSINSSNNISVKKEHNIMDESLKEKFLSNKEIRNELKYKKKFWFFFLLCIILLFIGIFIILSEKRMIYQANIENERLKNKISQMSSSNEDDYQDNSLLSKVKQLEIENSLLSKRNSELSAKLQDFDCKITRLTNDNSQLIIQLIDAKDKIDALTKGGQIIEPIKPTLGEIPLKLNVLCPKCFDNVPELSLYENKGLIMTRVKCENCLFDETKEINLFLDDLENNSKNIHYCEKEDGSHSKKEAEFFFNGKYYCSECANELKNILSIKDFKSIKNDTLLNKQCTIHNKKFVYYCPKCNKHFCDLISKTNHDKTHSLEILENMMANVNTEQFQARLKELEKFTNKDLLNIQIKLIQELRQMIQRTEKYYLRYTKRISDIVNLGNIALDNYIRTKDFPNYFIIKNMIYLSNLINNIKLPDLSRFEAYNLTSYNSGDYYLGFKNIAEEVLISPYNQLISSFNQSNIIKSMKDILLILTWLKTKGTFTKAKLIYKSSIDGYSMDKFLSKCEGQKATLSLFETKEGKRFGGFTKESWSRGSGKKIDPSSFLFSLDTEKIYSIKEPYYAIMSNGGCQEFGSSKGRISISCNENNQNGSADKLQDTYDNIIFENELTGSNLFELKENEVYSIKFIPKSSN